jgi:hypothetical protein
MGTCLQSRWPESGVVHTLHSNGFTHHSILGITVRILAKTLKILTEVFRNFLLYLKANVATLYLKQDMAASFQILPDSLFLIVSFGAIYTELLTASLNTGWSLLC